MLLLQFNSLHLKLYFLPFRFLIPALFLFLPCSWCTTYDDLLSTNQPFAQPIPLSVSFVVNLQTYCFLGFICLHASSDMNFIWTIFWFILHLTLRLAGDGRFFSWHLAWRRAVWLEEALIMEVKWWFLVNSIQTKVLLLSSCCVLSCKTSIILTPAFNLNPSDIGNLWMKMASMCELLSSFMFL